jgi:hypothetical protein
VQRGHAITQRRHAITQGRHRGYAT